MQRRQWYRVMGLAAVLAVSVVAGAQQTQPKQATKPKPTTKSHAAAAAPFDPCTGDGLPPSSQMAPFAPGSPGNINPPVPKTVKGAVKCSNGKCKAERNNRYAQTQDQPPSLPLSPGATKAGEANPAKQENAFPKRQSEAAQEKAHAMDAPQGSGAEANPFPEAKSAAAEAAAQKAANQSPRQQGVYSSSDQRLPGVNALGNGPAVDGAEATHPAFDPALAKRDDKVGKFYLHTRDWAGAYGRYKQATQVDPQDLQAVIGLAMAADHLGKRDEAIRNYKLYLDVKPNGKESKDALRALKRLAKES